MTTGSKSYSNVQALYQELSVAHLSYSLDAHRLTDLAGANSSARYRSICAAGRLCWPSRPSIPTRRRRRAIVQKSAGGT